MNPAPVTPPRQIQGTAEMITPELFQRMIDFARILGAEEDQNYISSAKLTHYIDIEYLVQGRRFRAGLWFRHGTLFPRTDRFLARRTKYVAERKRCKRLTELDVAKFRTMKDKLHEAGFVVFCWDEGGRFRMGCEDLRSTILSGRLSLDPQVGTPMSGA